MACSSLPERVRSMEGLGVTGYPTAVFVFEDQLGSLWRQHYDKWPSALVRLEEKVSPFRGQDKEREHIVVNAPIAGSVRIAAVEDFGACTIKYCRTV